MGKRFFYFLIIAGSMATVWAMQSGSTIQSDSSPQSESADQSIPHDERPAKIHPVVVNVPTAPKGVDTGKLDYHGNRVFLKCHDCHDVRLADNRTSSSIQLNEFHQGLAYQHGRLACVACHDATDGYESLHLADGSKVRYADAMNLCAQCHGPQHRDYQHGSHGGMTGYWDRTKGARRRNHCIDCHDPHSPQFPTVQPASGPNDRFAPSNKDIVH